MALEHRQDGPIRAVQHAFRVLESVDRHQTGVTSEDLSRETGVPPGHLAQLLSWLHREGYVHHQPGGAYVVGTSLLSLGRHARRRALPIRLQPALGRLRDEIGAAVYFSRYEEGEVRIIAYADGPDTPKVNEWVDFRVAAHASAVGKCLLTQLNVDEQREHIARHKLARFTSKTITNERALLTQLDAQPASAPTLDLQEYALGTVCAAVPATVGSAVGCLALSMPLVRAHRLREAAETLNRRAAPVLLSLAL